MLPSEQLVPLKQKLLSTVILTRRKVRARSYDQEITILTGSSPLNLTGAFSLKRKKKTKKKEESIT